MATLRVAWAIYGNDMFWFWVSLSMLVLGFVAGNDVGRAYRQPRDAKGRFR